MKVDKRLTELSENPLIGHPLGKKLNMDLTGFYKLYAVGKKNENNPSAGGPAPFV